MSVSADSAAAAIRTWFAGVPDQSKVRSVQLELPGGREAPNADGLVVPTRIAAEDGDVVVELDAPMEVRIRGLANVRAVSEAELRLEGFDELDATWGSPGQRQTIRYRDGDAQFVSGHLAAAQRAQPQEEGVRWENPI